MVYVSFEGMLWQGTIELVLDPRKHCQWIVSKTITFLALVDLEKTLQSFS